MSRFILLKDNTQHNKTRMRNNVEKMDCRHSTQERCCGMSQLNRTVWVIKCFGLSILLETFVKGSYYLNHNDDRILVTDIASTSA